MAPKRPPRAAQATPNAQTATTSARPSPPQPQTSLRTATRVAPPTYTHPTPIPAPSQPTSSSLPQPRPQLAQQLHTQQLQLDEEFRRAEQAYLNAYYPKRQHSFVSTGLAGPPPVQPSPTVAVCRAEPQSATAAAAEASTRRHQRGEPSLPAEPIPSAPSGTLQSSASHGEARQDVESDSEVDDDDDDDGNDGEDTPAADAGEDNANGTEPHSVPRPRPIQPITPLQYPAERPLLYLGPYDTIDQARVAVTEYAIAQGYMLVQSGSIRRKIAGDDPAAPTSAIRLDLICDRGGSTRYRSAGIRKRTTNKLGCPTSIKVICRKRDGLKWFIEPRCELHNHDLNLGKMDTLINYRRWRRMRGGGPSAEPPKERSERKKAERKPKPLGPVPPPVFHNVVAPPPSEPSGPVHMAAWKGQVKILAILLDKGGDIDAFDSTGRTALHWAIAGSRMDAVKVLVERGTNVSRADAKGLSPLRMAVERGLEDAVVLLIEKGADPNK